MILEKNVKIITDLLILLHILSMMVITGFWAVLHNESLFGTLQYTEELGILCFY